MLQNTALYRSSQLIIMLQRNSLRLRKIQDGFKYDGETANSIPRPMPLIRWSDYAAAHRQSILTPRLTNRTTSSLPETQSPRCLLPPNTDYGVEMSASIPARTIAEIPVLWDLIYKTNTTSSSCSAPPLLLLLLYSSCPLPRTQPSSITHQSWHGINCA